MAKSQETWNKKDREKKKQISRKDKAERKQERKDNAKEGKSFDDMIAYLDENGNLSSTPPDPRKKIQVNAEDIEIGVPKQREMEPGELIRTGIVSFFNESKGYGFIKDLQTQESIFVHANGLLDQVKENNKVTFSVEMGQRGPNAVQVKLAV
jgi:cold shock CspA family protein